MSAIRNTIQLSALFIIIMAAAAFVLPNVFTSQIRGEIDEALRVRTQTILRDISESTGIPAWFLRQDRDAFIGGSESYRSRDGKIIGPANAQIFDRDGYRTVPSAQLFSERYFKVIQSEFLPEAFRHDEDEDDSTEKLVEKELWRVYVTSSAGGSIVAYTPIHEVEDASELLPPILLSITVIIVATTLLGGLALGIRQQSRKTRIKDGLKQIAAGNLSYRLEPIQNRDDLDQLMFGIDEATAQLESSVRQLTDFLRNVAHELRIPLTQLRASLEMAENNGNLETAITKTNDLIRIFDAIQRISRLSRPDASARFSPVSLNAIATLMADLYIEVAEDKRQSLIVIPGADCVVDGDEQLLAQIVSNLVENAIRYTGPGAHITISTGDRSISVEDTGPGIPEKDRNKVFEAFYKRDLARSGGGTGLGLALVKVIADYHSATIRAF